MMNLKWYVEGIGSVLFIGTIPSFPGGVEENHENFNQNY
jgi:hypothetical protein